VRTAVICLLLLPVVFAQDWDLSKPIPSLRAKRMRKEADKLWAEAKPTCDLIAALDQSGKKDRRGRRTAEKQPEVKPGDIDPQAVADAVEKLELAALRYERSLKQEWNNTANLSLCNVITAWFLAQPHLPKPPPPADEKERKKQESAARKERTKNMGAARKRLMEYGAARRYQKLYHRCPRCEGRKDLRNPLDKRVIPCKLCRRTGLQVDRKGVVNARWMFNSPFYRADARRQLEVNRKLRLAKYDTKRLAPFVRSVRIVGKPEYHGTWIHIMAQEKVHTDPAGKRIEKTDASYVLYRIGKLWYLYHRRYDKQLVEVPEEEAAPKEG